MRGAVASASLLLSLPSMVGAVQYGYNHVTVRKDSDIIESVFQDVDVELLSPAFLTPEIRQDGFGDGTQGPTSHDDMDAYLEEVTGRNSYMNYHRAGFTSEEGHTFPYVLLSTGKDGLQRRVSGNDMSNKVRVWIQAAVHGNEPAGDEATQALLGKFDDDPEWAASILDKVDIVILPRYNPDGVFYFQRTLATNFDPNRDHIKLARQQTRDIKQLMNKFSPHVVVDMHEYGTSAVFGGRYQHASDGLFSAAKNLNINSAIRNMSETLFAPRIAADMQAAGLRTEPYVTGSSAPGPDFVATFAEAGTDGKIGRNAMGLTQAIVFLVENRGIGIADQEFQRRTASGLTMLVSIVETAAEEAADVYETVGGGIEDFIASTDDIVITDYSETEIRPFTMVDNRNGDIVRRPVRFASTTPAFANLTRSRPEAYLIPPAWADLAERMRVYGLEVETLEDGWQGSVEALTITSTSIASSYYEGVIRVTATAEAKELELSLPPGSFLVSTRQKNAALAMVALEPENIDSFVSFNIVPVAKGDEYPIFRVVS
ncbi:hypothetical protein NLU13_8171 [Sarocladium strictum]|uniref:Carboxypeptidase M14B n=1 Tax=Sarocladium strictum TaxID=5046 RepID=A0AA39GB56_SARSR|nr:hypothetical protein NLU13_8171 [Sarocladium strictum]